MTTWSGGMVETVSTAATLSRCGDRLIHVRRTGTVPVVNKRMTFNDPGHAHELAIEMPHPRRV